MERRRLMSIELLDLEACVTARADVRGTLAMDRNVPVGSQEMTREVMMKVEEGTDPVKVKRLQPAAGPCCVAQQTLKSPPPV